MTQQPKNATLHHYSNYSDKQLFEHLLGSIEIAQETSNISENVFDESIIHKDALCHRFYNIGVAIKNISQKIKDKYKESPIWIHSIWHHDFLDPYQLYTIAQEKSEDNQSKTDLEILFTEAEKIYIKEFQVN